MFWIRLVVLAIVSLTMLGCEKQANQPTVPLPLSYLVDEMENGVFMFRADPATDWGKGNDTVAFTSRLNQFVQERPEFRIKTHNVMETRDVAVKTTNNINTYTIATKILVFTEKREDKK